MAGLFVLVRRRNPRTDRAGAIDSLILTLGIALLSWVFLIAPNIQLGGDWLAEAVSIAYPVGDILLLAAAIRLAVDRGARTPAFYLLAGSIVCLLTTDSVYNRMLLVGSYNGQVILDVGWIFYYLLWGAAALHPSMRTLEQPAEGRTRLDAAAARLPERGLPDRPGHPLLPGVGQHRRDRGDRRVDDHVPARAGPHGRARAPGGAGRLAPARPAPRRRRRSSARRASTRSRPPRPPPCASSRAATPTRASSRCTRIPPRISSRRPCGRG